MWIYLKDRHLSVVAQDADVLTVRARRAEHLADFESDVVSTPDRDYQYRITMDKADFSRWLARQVLEIDYGNFKGAITCPSLRCVSNDVWAVAYKLAYQRTLNLDVG